MKVTVTCVTQKRVLESFKFYSLTVNRGTALRLPQALLQSDC